MCSIQLKNYMLDFKLSFKCELIVILDEENLCVGRIWYMSTGKPWCEYQTASRSWFFASIWLRQDLLLLCHTAFSKLTDLPISTSPLTSGCWDRVLDTLHLAFRYVALGWPQVVRLLWQVLSFLLICLYSNAKRSL